MIRINELNLKASNYTLHSEQCGITRRGGRLDVITEDYYYIHEGIQLFIPKGFKWDGASIPKILWPILGGPFGRYSFAAMVHDFLYASREVPREVADQIFYDLMLAHGVSKFKSKIMYKAVSMFGRKAYEDTDERGAIACLYPAGHRLNPYDDYMPVLSTRGWCGGCYGFEKQPWVSMDEETFKRQYSLMMIDKLHM